MVFVYMCADILKKGSEEKEREGSEDGPWSMGHR